MRRDRWPCAASAAALSLSLSLSLLPIAVVAAAQQSVSVSVFVPGYRASAWEGLRGSVITSDDSETLYTIFCADQTANNCQIDGDLPFTFAEGPKTLHFSGADPGTITAALDCQLQGTTAAVCRGYSSFGEDYYAVTGATETAWTRTMSGDDIHWGILTLSSPAPPPDTVDIDGTPIATETSPGETANPTDTEWFFPTSTGGSSTPTSTVPSALAAPRLDGSMWRTMYAVVMVLAVNFL